MILESLLGDVPPASFLQEHYLRFPFSRAGGCQHLAGCGDWPLIERLLAHPGADVIVGREGKQWEGKTPTTASAAREVLAAGYMFGVRHAEQLDERLAELAAQFQADFAAPIDIHLYCTPAGHPGFGWHYDAEEVFVLQLHGSKEWWLRKNTVNPWPLVETLPENMRHEREVMPVMRCTLADGDWLYIPTGYWHRTQAVTNSLPLPVGEGRGEGIPTNPKSIRPSPSPSPTGRGDRNEASESISLSVGVLARAAIDVFDYLRPRLLSSLLWRQRLPITATREQLQELFRTLGDDMLRTFTEAETLAAYVAARLPERPTGPQPAADEHQLDARIEEVNG